MANLMIVKILKIMELLILALQSISRKKQIRYDKSLKVVNNTFIFINSKFTI